MAATIRCPSRGKRFERERSPALLDPAEPESPKRFRPNNAQHSAFAEQRLFPERLYTRFSEHRSENRGLPLLEPYP